MEVLNLATLEKQNEILSNFPISGGTDLYKYDRIAINNFLASSYNNWGVALEINGEGFIYHAILGYAANNATGIKIKITLDNEVILEGSTPSHADELYGIANSNLLNALIVSNGIYTTKKFDVEYTLNTIGIPIIINPILFRNMLKIEYQSSSSSRPYINFIGGVKID